MIILHQSCPRCRIKRTARVSGTFHCFNCRYQWTSLGRLIEPAEPAYPFTPSELERLATYRGAVRAGVYSDFLHLHPPIYA